MKHWPDKYILFIEFVKSIQKRQHIRLQHIGLLFLALTFLFFDIAAQQKLTKKDFAYQYDAHKLIDCQLRFLNAGDTIKVYMQLKLDSTQSGYADLIDKEQWTFHYGVAENYEIKNFSERNTLALKPEKRSFNKLYFKFTIARPRNLSTAFFFLQYFQTDEEKRLISDYALKFMSQPLTHNILLFDKTKDWPVFDNYLSNTDTVSTHNYKQEDQAIFIKYYDQKMKIAYPPMVYAPSESEAKYKPDTIYSIHSNETFILVKPGTYQITSDTFTSGHYLQTFVVAEEHFPKYVQPDKLISPLIYIASDTERKNLFNAQKPKYSLDDFWMSLGGNYDFSRKLIRYYYRQIYKANKLFTHYKHGWKTDRGMIYVVYGKPDKVLKTATQESWHYKDADIEYVFKKKINAFNEYYYELERSRDYGNIWFKNVEKWREGKYLKN